jgi:hypothetical protein
MHGASKGSLQNLRHPPLTRTCRRAGSCGARSMAPTTPDPIATSSRSWQTAPTRPIYSPLWSSLSLPWVKSGFFSIKFIVYLIFLGFFKLVDNLCVSARTENIHVLLRHVEIIDKHQSSRACAGIEKNWGSRICGNRKISAFHVYTDICDDRETYRTVATHLTS